MDLYNASLEQQIEDEPMELTLEQYEEGKAHFKSIMERGDAARRLATNPDFITLVMDGYFVKEATRLQELITSGRVNKQIRENIADEMTAIGSFRNYMKTHIEQSNLAADELASLEEAYNEMVEGATS